MNSVILKRYNKIEIEKVAAEAITPGHLVELTSDDEVQKHSVEAGNVVPMFALEDGLIGNPITTDIVADETCMVWIPQRGDEVYAILTTSQTVVIGDLLSSKGDGTLKKHVPEASDYYEATDVTVKPLQIVAQAIEAVTTTTAVSRIKVRIV
jgi:hypothetical protein